MLDRHQLDARIHGVGDFFLELLTITIGLFIALGLNGYVERAGHRHLRDEADANLRQEIRDNRHELKVQHAAIVDETANLLRAVQFLQAQGAGKPYDIHNIKLGYSTGPLSDASWRTASATGALNYMEYSHVQAYAAAYQVQEELARVQASTLEDFLQLQSYIAGGADPTKLTRAEAQSALMDVRHALAHLNAMDQLAGGLDQAYQKALASK